MEVDQPQQANETVKPRVCCNSEYSCQVLSSLNEQREKGLFCDIELVADGVRFLAHRNILAASSSYFNAMFTLGMRESYQKEVELSDASSIGCKIVLEFLYGNKPSLDSSSVYCVMKTAHLLQIWKLIDVCCEYLETELNEENYIQLQELASTYSLGCLDSSIDRFILKNFEKLCFTPSFMEKVSVEKLCLYLDSDMVEMKIEQDLLKVALQWLSHCPERADLSQRVLQNIRFSLMPKKDLLDLTNPEACSMLPQQANIQSLIDEANHYQNNVTAQPVLQNRRSTLRVDGTHLLFLGGETKGLDSYDDEHSNEDWDLRENDSVFFLDTDSGKWIPETRMPAWRGGCCVAVLNNFIFLGGGFTWNIMTHRTSNLVFRYDPRCKKWTKVAAMNQAREFFSLTALEDKLIAIGGSCAGRGVLDTVEVYCPQKDSWSYAGVLPRSTGYHAGVIYKQHIYVSGGVRDMTSRSINDVLRYDYSANLWERKTDMVKARCHHSMCTLNDSIYAIGGEEGPVEGQALIIKSVECYSPTANQWTTVAPLCKASSSSGVAVWRGEIYVVGGMQHIYGYRTKMVQVYDQEKNIWYRGRDLEVRVGEASACVCALRK